MKLSKTRMFRRIGTRNIARYWFGIPKHLIEEYFQDYFLHKYLGKDIIKLSVEGIFTGGYIIYYHNITRGEILANPDKQYTCSFRIPKAELNLPAYVLIGRG